VCQRRRPPFPEQAAQRLAAEGKAFDFVELFAEMMVVEAGIFGARQMHNGLEPSGNPAELTGIRVPISPRQKCKFN
jgi:hypothetical protein